MPAVNQPTRIRKEGDGLVIDWDDGQSGFVSWQRLRDACPCAGCKEERNQPPNPFRILKPEEIAAGAPRATSMSPIGHYAYKIVWNDGHDSGIYPLELLYQLCNPKS